MADNDGGRNRARKFQGYACFSSAVVLAALGAGRAQAQCAPNPSQAYQAIDCSGTQTGGYTISTDQSPIIVNGGASIQNGGDALTVSIPANSYYDYHSTAITVNGSIVSSGGNGILIDSGMPYQIYYGYTGTSGTITVGAAGSISGATGITLSPYPGNSSSYAPVSISLDNFGSITGTGGTALATTGTYPSFSTITNESSGTIGAIAASFGTLANHGTIDGGSLTAVNNAVAYGSSSLSNDGTIKAEGTATTVLLNNSYSFTNSGTITNTGGGIAILNPGTVINETGGTIAANGSDVVTGTYLSLVNSGAIANTGAGQAVSGSSLNITNTSGATISAGSGGTAINASSSLSLVNLGTINGDVLAGSASASYQSVSVDSSQGTINGNVIFGAGNNTLVAAIVNGAVQTGVTGTITAGTGTYATNSLEITTLTNATLSTGVALPTNFSQLEFNPIGGTSLTLGGGFSSTGVIVYNGYGTLVNATTLSGSNQIVSEGLNAGIFSNTGSITSSNLGGPAAIGLSGYAAINNSGTITSTGDGISGSGSGVINSGTITSGGTAVSVFLDTGYSNDAFSNTGTISSSLGTGVALSLTCTCFTASNGGTISGAAIGLQFTDGEFTNTGTITSPGYAITLTYYATINNQAGGVISGGTYAIGDPNGAPGLDYVNNAGTINGNVNLANNGFATNTYYAVPGGILNGNLTLGSGDTLITSLVDTGSGAFAGITGTVAASQSNLVYNVGSSATVSGTAPAGFSSITYQLSNAPTLTFDTATSYNSTLGLAGTGSVVFGGTIATTDAVALQSQAYLAPAGNTNTPTALTITNNGTISATRTIADNPPYFAITLQGADSLVNNGTIAFNDQTGAPSYQSEAAVSGGQSITNNGTISGSGAAAIATGGLYGTSQALINTGTLTSDAITVLVFGTADISNSGTITTSGQAAIDQPGYYGYGSAVVNNLAGGTISGPGDAIDLQGGSVSNAGTIDGNVNLAYSPYGYPVFSSGAYLDKGGTLNGNLTLNPYEALVIDGAGSGNRPLGGVTGTINANGATLVFNVTSDATASATSGGASGFGATGYLISNNATLTLDAISKLTATLDLAGSGSVVFNGTITTNDTPALISQYSSLLTATGTPSLGGALNITNNGTIATSADANFSPPVAVSLSQSDTLTNNGTISLVSTNPAPGYAAVSGGASVTNAGTISATNANAVNVGGSYYGTYNSLGETVTNSGSITSNLLAIAENGLATVTNSGDITSTGGAAIGFTNAYGYYFGSPANIINQASGVISGVGDAIDVQGGAVSNAGTIDGNVNLVYTIYGSPYGDIGLYADDGGTLNGNLTLGANQALVINGANPGAGPLGGVTGTIAANGAALIYNVGSDATTSASSNGAGGISGFGTVGYLLSNAATLTIAAGSNLTSTLSVAGSGSVILNGAIATSDVPGVVAQASALAIPSGLALGNAALTITNNGTITTSADANVSYTIAVGLGGSDTLINNGTISLNSTNTQNFYGEAVSGGLNVINAGTISATNASAIYVGNGNPLGETVTNTGTISSNLLAITETGAATVTNSGTIVSTGGAAIGIGAYYGFFGGYSEQIVNLTGGVITGQGDAIDMDGGIVSNAGNINGNVDLADGYLLYAPGAYYDNGGTLNGNLTLGQNQALVVDYVATGNPLGGVTGTINASGAALFYNLTADATIASAPIAAGFASVGYQLSNNATLTLASNTLLTQTLSLTGQGAVVLGGSIVTSDQAAVLSQAPFAIGANAPTTTALTITNNGSIAATTNDADVYVNAAVALGSGDTLVNNGTISRTNLGISNLYETAVSGGLALTNTGTILGLGVSAVGATSSYVTGTASTIANSGTITSDQFAILIGGAATITNSGTITSTGLAAISPAYFYSSGTAESEIDNLAGGVISGVGDAIDLAGGLLANAGTINGNVDLAESYYGINYAPGAYFNSGGTLNGNLTLGPSQSLYTQIGSIDTGNIGNAGSVQGITGTVTPNNAYLIYLVSADGSDSVITPAGFGGIGYQLSNNATLTLSPAGTLSAQIDLSGTGSVIFNGSIATVALPAIISAPNGTLAGGATTPNDLTITNNGTLSTALQSNISFKPSTVFLTSGDTLINTGAIVLTNATGQPFPTAAAVYGGEVLINTGTISAAGANAVSLGVPSTSSTTALSLTNSGSITSDQLAVTTNGAAAITNSGTISGGAGALLLGGAAQIVNSGSITSSTGVAIAGTGAGTLITNQVGGVISGSSDAIDLLGGTVANSGTINGNVNLAFGATVPSGPLSGGYFASGGALNGNLTLGQGEALVTDVANPGAGITGTVTASGAALIYNVYADTTSTAALPTGFTSLAYQLFNDPVLTLASGSNLATTLGLAGSGAVIFAGTIATSDAAALVSQPVLTAAGYAVTANALKITNNGMISAMFDAAATAAPGAVILGSGDSLTNSGTITGSGAPAVIDSGTGQLVNLAGAAISSTTDAIDFAGGAVNNAGTITGNVDLGYVAAGASANTAPAIYFANGGTVSGNLSFSSASGGNELIETGAGFGVTGTISGGAGTNYVGHLIGVDGAVALGNLPTGFSVELTYVDGASHQVTLIGPANYAANIYVGGDGAIVNQANTSGIVTGLAASGETYLAGMNAQLASFTNQVQVGGIALATDTLVNSGTVGSATTSGSVLTQSVGGTLFFANTGTIVAQPGSGVAAQLAVAITGTPTGASQIGNSGTITGGLGVGYAPAAGATLTITNSGTITGGPFGGAPAVALAVLPSGPNAAGDALSVTNSGTITGDIELAAAGTALVDAAGGAIRGNIILQPGVGTGSIALAGNFVGSIDGGQASTSLAVSGGSAAQPVAFGSITGIAGYNQTGGYAILTGTANVGNATIAGGTFVGLTGSTINASVAVGSGATFASGGTVNGNLAVAGTLHVGASPDLLTVNGNVTLAAGSTSIFEVSPTASSQLAASGKVTIGANTTLQIVQLQPIMPGSAIDLVTAAGGISGNFTTFSGIAGALIEKNDQLELVALFATPQTANPQVANGVNYLNTLLASGNAAPALLAALPALTTASGAPNGPAFARLTPQTYASATQIGVENGLIVARAVRDIGWDTAIHSGHVFTFGEALGNWRGLAGNAALGVGHSDLSGYGFLGGIGVGSPAAWVAAFGGYLNQDQDIADLAASTHAKGFVSGVTGRLANGPAQLDLSVIYDHTHATTERLSPDDLALSGTYRLHGWTVDGEASTNVALGYGWSAHPHVGATWIWTRRGSTVEDDTSAFALTVAADRHQAGFVDGGIRLESPQGEIGRITSFADIGARYQVQGREADAIAGLAGAPVSLFAYGTRRRPVGATVATGATYRATAAVSLFVSGNGDFSRGETSGAVNGGVKVQF